MLKYAAVAAASKVASTSPATRRAYRALGNVFDHERYNDPERVQHVDLGLRPRR